MSRHQLSLRAKTTVCQKVPAELVSKLVDMILYIRNIRAKNKYEMGSIIAADETVVWFDNPRNTTIEQRGAKEDPILTTGHDKLRITVLLAAKADGKKLLPYVVLNRKRPIPELSKEFTNKLVISYAGQIWMNDGLTADFLDRVVGRQMFKPRLLVWDAFRYVLPIVHNL